MKKKTRYAVALALLVPLFLLAAAGLWLALRADIRGIGWDLTEHPCGTSPYTIPHAQPGEVDSADLFLLFEAYENDLSARIHIVRRDSTRPHGLIETFHEAFAAAGEVNRHEGVYTVYHRLTGNPGDSYPVTVILLEEISPDTVALCHFPSGSNHLPASPAAATQFASDSRVHFLRRKMRQWGSSAETRCGEK